MFNKFICSVIAVFAIINLHGQCVGCPGSLTAPGSLAAPSIGFNGFTSEVHTYNGVKPTCYLPVSNTLNGHLQGINNALCMLKDSLGFFYEKDSVALSAIDSIINVLDSIQASMPDKVNIISSDGSITVVPTGLTDSVTFDISIALLAQNGLYLDGNIIKQGSPLTEDTYINGDGYYYALKGLSRYSGNGDTISITVGDSSVVGQGLYFIDGNDAYMFGTNVFTQKDAIDNTFRIGKDIVTGTNKEGTFIGNSINATDLNTANIVAVGDNIDILNSVNDVVVVGFDNDVDQRGDSTIILVGKQNNVRGENFSNVIIGDDNVVKDGYSTNLAGGLVVGQDNLINSSLGYILGVGNDFKNLGAGFIVGSNNEVKNKVGAYVFGDGNIVEGNGITGNRSALIFGTNIEVTDPEGYTCINMDNSVAGKLTNTKIATDYTFTFTVNANQYKFYTNTQSNVGVYMDKNDLSWSVMSDSTIKTNYKVADYKSLYNKFKGIPINTWSLKADTAKRHVGIFAQDFYTLMKSMGITPKDNKSISQTDMDGVLMALIKQQSLIIEDLEKRVKELEKSK